MRARWCMHIHIKILSRCVAYTRETVSNCKLCGFSGSLNHENLIVLKSMTLQKTIKIGSPAATTSETSNLSFTVYIFTTMFDWFTSAAVNMFFFIITAYFYNQPYCLSAYCLKVSLFFSFFIDYDLENAMLRGKRGFNNVLYVNEKKTDRKKRKKLTSFNWLINYKMIEMLMMKKRKIVRWKK